MSELPEGVGKLPAHAKEIYRSAFNAAHKQYKEEDRAHKVAWAAVKNKYKKTKEGNWEKKGFEDETPFLLWTDSFEYKAHNGDYFVRGYISHEGVDLVNDYVTPECLQDMVSQIKGKSVSVKLGKDHEHVLDDPRIMPLAKILDAQYDGKGVFADIKMNKAHPLFNNVWDSISGGFYDSFSIEFKPTDYSYDVKDGQQVRKLNKVYLGGVTFTGRPICPACKITDTFIKSLAVFEDKKGDTMEKKDITFVSPTKPTVPDPTKPVWAEKVGGITFPQGAKPSYTDPTSGVGYSTKDADPEPEADPEGVEGTGVQPTTKKPTTLAEGETIKDADPEPEADPDTDPEADPEKKKKKAAMGTSATTCKGKMEKKSWTVEEVRQMIHEELKALEPKSKLLVEPNQQPLETKSAENLKVAEIMAKQMGFKG